MTANAQADWKTDGDNIVQAAENEGQVTVYIGGYGAVIDTGVFQKAYPKIKVVRVTGSGTDLTGRIATERRAGKYLSDVIAAHSGQAGDSSFPSADESVSQIVISSQRREIFS